MLKYPLGFILLCLWIQGCATSLSYRITSPPPQRSDSIVYLENVPPIEQEAFQCGPASLSSVFHYWNRDIEASTIASEIQDPHTRGVFNFMLIHYAQQKGFWAQQIAESDISSLQSWIRNEHPLIAMLYTGFLWVPRYHFVVIKGFNDKERIFYVNTGEETTQAIQYEDFVEKWNRAGNWAMVLAPPEEVTWPLPPDLKYNFANLLMTTGHLKRARSLYQELIKTKPKVGFTEIHNNLAWTYYMEGRYQKTISVIEHAWQKGAERRFDILDTLGLAYCKVGQKNKGRGLLEEALIEAKSIQKKSETRVIKDHLKACAI